MRIEHLKLTNFRNYGNLEIDFNKNVNIFVGDNGKGKTNILESIYVLSLTKSNRYGIDENLIKFNEELAKIEGLIRYEDLLKKQEIKISKTKKQTFIINKEMFGIQRSINSPSSHKRFVIISKGFWGIGQNKLQLLFFSSSPLDNGLKTI